MVIGVCFIQTAHAQMKCTLTSDDCKNKYCLMMESFFSCEVDIEDNEDGYASIILLCPDFLFIHNIIIYRCISLDGKTSVQNISWVLYFPVLFSHLLMS